MAVAAFDWSVWQARFPELVAKGITEPLAADFFAEAGLLLDNTDCSIVEDVAIRGLLLNLIVAHLAALSGTVRGVGAPVGRTSSVSEGSVSASFDYVTMSQSQAYWAQTPYGAQYWQSVLPYRSFRYVPGPQRYTGTAFWPSGYPFGGNI